MSADADRVHMALMTAASAAAMGKSVILYFAKSGAKVITTDGWSNLKSSCGKTSSEMDANLESKGVADFSILIDALAALDVSFYVCDSAIAEHEINAEDIILRPRVDVGGLTSLIQSGSGGDWLTF